MVLLGIFNIMKQVV